MSLIGAFACLAVPALAAEPKPDAAIKTKTIEANVFLDDKIKADPALAADCLAEGKAWAEKNRADAAKERKQDPQMFRDGAWTFERKYADALGGRRSLCQHRQVRLHGHRRRASEYRRQHHPVGEIREQAHQHPSLLHRDRRQRPDHEGDGESRHRLAEGRKEEARRQRDRHGRMVQGPRAEAAQDRRGDAGAIDRCQARAPA